MSYYPPGARTITAEETVDLTIAGIRYRFLTDVEEIAGTLRRRFPESVTPAEGQADLITRMRLLEEPYDNSAPVAEIEVTESEIRVRGGSGFHGTVDRTRRTAELSVWLEFLPIAIENYLRMVNAVLVLERGGVHVHSCGVIRDGRGYLFFGPADAGKTTTAQLSAAYDVLSDDQNVLLVDGDQVLLEGIPMRSAMCPVDTVPGRAPLARLLRLRQASENRLEPVPRGLAAAMLASQAPFVNFQPVLAERLLQNCLDIVERVPVEMLYFTRGPEFWTIL